MVARRIVGQTLSSLSPADTLLAGSAADFSERDRRFLAELVYGVLRWLRRLDHVIGSAAERSPEAIDSVALQILRVGTVQLLALERVPAHAAVSEAVDDARRHLGRGVGGFVNAVLRRIANAPRFEEWPVAERDPVEQLAIEQSHPSELVARWWSRFGEERTRSMLVSNNGPRRLHLLAFRARGGPGPLAETLAAEGVATRRSTQAPLGLVVERGNPLRGAAFGRGEFYVQDEASQAAALVPAPVTGERILDAAAAPGGKGLALLASEPGARVIFADRSLTRLQRLEENLARLALDLPCVAVDATLPAWRRAFDRVLVDAPCSGTGTLRRHPELRWRFRGAELERLSEASAEMLEASATGVLPGGLLVLITCSVEPEENEQVVERFLRQRREFAPAELDFASLPPGEASDAGDGRWRILPVDGHDGFSVHVIRLRG